MATCYLILGATGLIGNYLYGMLRMQGEKVFGTSRRIKEGGPYINFDAMADSVRPLLSQIDGDIKGAVCFGETNINACFENYKEAYKVNVVKTKKILSALADRNAHIIYFSTDNVFDGKSGKYTEESRPNPINKYGEMKTEIEAFILRNMPKSCILRLPKVISIKSKKKSLFADLEAGYEKGIIPCIKGNRRSHIYIDDVYRACRLAWEKHLHGIYHIADDVPYTRAELATKFLDMMGEYNSVIREYELSWFHMKDGYPLDVSLCNKKFKEATAYSFADMSSVMQKYIDNRIYSINSYL